MDTRQCIRFRLSRHLALSPIDLNVYVLPLSSCPCLSLFPPSKLPLRVPVKFALAQHQGQTCGGDARNDESWGLLPDQGQS